MEPSVSAASSIAVTLDHNIKCPLCHLGRFRTLPFDNCPTGDIMVCETCKAELYVVVLKGK